MNRLLQQNENIPDSSQLNKSKPFSFNSPRQNSIYDRLKRLVGPGAAAFYKDACRHITIEPQFDATTHIVGHLLREIESTLRDVLEPFTDSTIKLTGNNQANHQQEIKAILQSLEIQETEPVAKAWLSLTGKHDGSLNGKAHRKDLDQARPLDQDFRVWWFRMEEIFDTILDRFESQYAKAVFVPLDELVKKSNPTQEDIKIIRCHIPNNFVAHQRFFSQLHHPNWLSLLKKEGVFSEPPMPEYDGKGRIRHTPWPEAIYLERIANIAPQIVTEILKEIKDVDNANVKSSLLSITIKLPKDNRLELLEKLKIWIKSEHRLPQLVLIKPGSEVINKFLEDGDENAAFQLAEGFLEILPGSRLDPDEPSNSFYKPYPEPHTRLNQWDYIGFLNKEFQKLTDKSPKRAFNLLCQLLASYLELSYLHKEEKIQNYEDNSLIWFPAIGDEEQNGYCNDIKNALATKICDIALKIVTQDTTLVVSIFAELEDKRWPIFRRIGLYLLSKFPGQSKDLVSQQLVNKVLFDDADFKRDYTRLMNKGFQFLSSKDQKTLLNWINDEKNEEIWQLDMLSYIKNYLPEDCQKRYAALIEIHGEPEYPSFPFLLPGSWSEPISEVNSKELADMDIEKLIELLRDWKPKNIPHSFKPTKEDLSYELSTAIKSNPNKFKDFAEKFTDLDPIYIKTYIQTFSEIIRSKGIVNWPKILKLCTWVIEQPNTIPGKENKITTNQEMGWRWTRKTIASFICIGTNSDTIPFELRENVWKIIEPLTKDLDPTPEDERVSEEYSEDSCSFANCIRGEAMSAAIEYALWVCRHEGKQTDGTKKIKIGFNLMPEVRSVLEWHLNNANDPSVSVHAVYGRYLPWLLLIDRAWFLKNIDKILPPNQFNNRLYAVAWNTLMLYVPAYNDVFDVLGNRYKEAIDNLDKVDGNKHQFVERDKKLVEHLMLFLIRKKINLRSELSIRFWLKASDELRAHAIGFIGDYLKNNNNQVDTETIEHLKVLWQWRLVEEKEASNKSAYEKEMGAFSSWFASGKFDEKWSCDKYLISLDISGEKSHTDHFVLRRLTEVVKTYPIEAVKILSKVLLMDHQDWIVLGSRNEIDLILSTALKYQNITAQKEARNLINKLIARGYIDFHSLITEKPLSSLNADR